MKVILFDLGNTLVKKNDNGYELIEGATELLQSIKSIKEINNEKLDIGIVSDTHGENEHLSETQKMERKNLVLDILESNNIKQFFEPIDIHLTLSSDLGFTKSKNMKEFLEQARNKMSDNTVPRDILFVTEEKLHITLAKNVGVTTFHYNPQLNSSDDETINKLADLIPKIALMINTT